MRRIIGSFLFIILLISNYGYTREILIDGKNEDYLLSCIIPSYDENPLRYMIFNLFDNNLATTIAINSKYIPYRQEVKFPYFRIIFKKPYKVDKIVIYNGFQKSDELYYKNERAKEISITVLNYTDKKKEEKYSVSIETNFLLIDSKEGQVFILPDVSGEHWIIDVHSTYPGTLYDDICISEIEFWYKGEKYEVKNLEQAKREYLNMLREEIWRSVIVYAKPFGDTEEKSIEMTPLIFEPMEGLRRRWKELGVDVERIKMEKYFHSDGQEWTECWINFIEEKKKDFKGRIIAEGKKKSGKKMEWIPIGEWKIDEYANLWIKIGKGKWKRGIKDRPHFASTLETDLGVIAFIY